jgi:hypothetical protein
MTPSVPILFSVLSENDMKAIRELLNIVSEVRDVFNLSASDNLVAALLPIFIPVRSENETSILIRYQEVRE